MWAFYWHEIDHNRTLSEFVAGALAYPGTLAAKVGFLKSIVPNALRVFSNLRWFRNIEPLHFRLNLNALPKPYE